MICIKCNQDKSPLDFYARKEVKGGKRRDCKTCVIAITKKNYFKDAALSRKKHADYYHGFARKMIIERKYGIPYSEYERMVLAQKNKCAICSRMVTWNLHVDHDHNTKKIRGLLCQWCNVALGCFRDSQKILLLAINYLKNNGAPSPETGKEIKPWD